VSFYVLDTDHVSLAQRNHPAVLQHLALTDPAEISVTIITVEEQLRGWLKVVRRAPRGPRLASAYSALRAAMYYYRRIRMLDFDAEASELYEGLLAQKIRIGTHDLRIAATVLSVGGILVTRNKRDFSRVPGLRCDDWTTPSPSVPS
jgi:tRNA(fMet)-specific endonuclease VapC